MSVKQKLNNIAEGIARFLAQHPELIESYSKAVVEGRLTIRPAQDIFNAMDGENWIRDEDRDIGLFCEAVGIAYTQLELKKKSES